MNAGLYPMEKVKLIYESWETVQKLHMYRGAIDATDHRMELNHLLG